MENSEKKNKINKNKKDLNLNNIFLYEDEDEEEYKEYEDCLENKLKDKRKAIKFKIWKEQERKW